MVIPQSIKEAVGRRLNRQGASCIEMLHTAAALGKRFSFAELAVVAGQGENELLDALNFYLHNPTAELPAMRRFRESECTYLDGNAGRRTAQYFLSLLEERK